MPSLVEEIISYGIQVDQIIKALAGERDQLKVENKSLNDEIVKLKAEQEKRKSKRRPESGQ